MKAYQQGDFAAFDTLYRIKSPRLYRYLQKRVSRKEWVDECFQSVFLKFHHARHLFDPAYSVDQWLFAIARSALLDHFRKQGREVDIDTAITVEDLMDCPERAEQSEIAMEGLSSEQKKVVEWRALDEVSYREIAERLNQSEASIRKIFSRAVKKLREGLSKGVVRHVE